MGRGSGIKAVPCHSFRDKKTKKKKQKTHSLFLNKKIAIVAIQLNETRNVRTRDVPAIISTPGLSNNSRERANIMHEFSHPLQLTIRSAQKKRNTCTHPSTTVGSSYMPVGIRGLMVVD